MLPQRRWRWPLFTPLKVNFMLNWLEKKDPSFNRDEFLEGAKGAFAGMMEKFPPDRPERFREVLDPALYRAMLDSSEAYQQSPLRIAARLEKLESAEIVNVHILADAEQEELPEDEEELKQQPETVHIEVKFDCVEQLTTQVEVEGKPAQVISKDVFPRSHEWVFEGTFRPGSSPLWKLAMI